MDRSRKSWNARCSSERVEGSLDRAWGWAVTTSGTRLSKRTLNKRSDDDDVINKTSRFIFYLLVVNMTQKLN